MSKTRSPSSGWMIRMTALTSSSRLQNRAFACCPALSTPLLTAQRWLRIARCRATRADSTGLRAPEVAASLRLPLVDERQASFARTRSTALD